MPAVFLLLGVILLYLAGLCWSGRWRTWVEWSSPTLHFGAIPGFLGTGLLFIVLGAFQPPAGPAENAFLGVFLLGFTFCIGSAVVDPPWFGPRWYREFRRAFEPCQSGSLQVWPDDPRRPGETSVTATERHRRDGRPRPPSSWVRLVNDPTGVLDEFRGDKGVLGYWPQAPVLSFSHVDKTDLWHRRKIGERIIGAESIIAVQRQRPGTKLDGSLRRSGIRTYLVPRVRVDTTDGMWLFEARKAKKIVKELNRRYAGSRPHNATATGATGRLPADAARREE